MQRKETDAPPPDDFSEIVSVVSMPRGSRNICWIRLIKTFSMLLFLCGLVGAFVYAVNSKGENNETKELFNYSLPYSVRHSQCSSKGKYVHSIISPPQGQIDFNGTSFWYQDDDKKFLNYQKDNATVVWVFETNSFWARINEKGEAISCKEDPKVGYDEYIYQLSLTNMYNRHSERRQMRANTKVYVFDSDPVKWEHENVEPYLVQAFAAADDGRLIEFQHHYTQTLNHGWFALSYVFSDMKSGKPSEDILGGLPKLCQPSS